MKSRYIILYSALLFLSGCKDWDYDHTFLVQGAQDESENTSNSSWKNQGFTLDEYHIYKQAGMSPYRNDSNSALPWKEANIPAEKAVEYYQKWKTNGVSSKEAVYFISHADATPTQFKQAMAAIDAHYDIINKTAEEEENGGINRKVVIKIIKKIQNGTPANKAVLDYIQEENKKAVNEERAQWPTDILQSCGDIPRSIYTYTISNDSQNPYSVNGKCYTIDTPYEAVRWISDHQVIIIPMPQISTTNFIYIYSDSPFQNDKVAIVKGVSPQTFTNVFGGDNVIASFEVIGYK